MKCGTYWISCINLMQCSALKQEKTTNTAVVLLFLTKSLHHLVRRVLRWRRMPCAHSQRQNNFHT